MEQNPGITKSLLYKGPQLRSLKVIKVKLKCKGPTNENAARLQQQQQALFA